MPQQSFSSCTAINQRFLTESGRIGPDSHIRGREAEPLWLGLVKQKPWQSNMGTIVRNTIYERSGLTTAPTWQAVAPSDGAAVNACLPPLTVISNSSTTQEFQRYHIALESDPLCLQDIMDSNNPRAAIRGFQDNLMGNATYVRKERVRSEYQRLANHKIVVAAGLPEDETAFPLTLTTAPMSMGILRRKYWQLDRESSGTSGVNRLATGSRGNTNYIFISSGETIENMIKNDTGIRDDFRWSTRANELLGSYGEKFSYGGFIMWQDSFTERYNWTGAAYVRVPEYISAPATLGNKLEINQYYEHALAEVSYIFHPDVMVSRVPDPQTSYGDVVYGAKNYSLEWKWINEHDRNCNPDKTIGYFRALGMHATEPVFRQFGYCFLALRCDPAADLTTGCTSGSGYASGPWS